MKITKCFELTDRECLIFDTAMLIIHEIHDCIMPDCSYADIFDYLLEKYNSNNDSLPKIIDF